MLSDSIQEKKIVVSRKGSDVPKKSKECFFILVFHKIRWISDVDTGRISSICKTAERTSDLCGKRRGAAFRSIWRLFLRLRRRACHAALAFRRMCNEFVLNAAKIYTQGVRPAQSGHL